MDDSLNSTKMPISKIRAIDSDKLRHYYLNGYCLFYDKEQQLSCLFTNDDAYQTALAINRDQAKYYKVTHPELVQVLENSFHKASTNRAINYLSSISPKYNAKVINYRKMVAGFLLLFVASIYFSANSFHAFNNVIYLIQNFFKQLLFYRASSDRSWNLDDINKLEPDVLEGEELPIYTIFVPLYKEVNKVGDIVCAIENLDYPKSRLDVKLIVEIDDRDMLKALNIITLPSYVEIVKVPYSMPRTKPKAMNYATPYIKGEYLCVYDAEDVPDPEQLKKALAAFRKLPQEYACVQARLNFYNANQNILTKFFSMEYSLWFDYLLAGLSVSDLPLTLGGTSNHFKVSVLEKVGYWDAYNVTEDAELGIRLYANGYKIAMLDSYTMEEAPISINNWIMQRSRWIKGFIQTFYIFLITPAKEDVQ